MSKQDSKVTIQIITDQEIDSEIINVISDNLGDGRYFISMSTEELDDTEITDTCEEIFNSEDNFEESEFDEDGFRLVLDEIFDPIPLEDFYDYLVDEALELSRKIASDQEELSELLQLISTYYDKESEELEN